MNENDVRPRTLPVRHSRVHRARLVSRQRDGARVVYAIASSTVMPIVDLVARDVLREITAVVRRLGRMAVVAV